MVSPSRSPEDPTSEIDLATPAALRCAPFTTASAHADIHFFNRTSPGSAGHVSISSLHNVCLSRACTHVINNALRSLVQPLTAHATLRRSQADPLRALQLPLLTVATRPRRPLPARHAAACLL